MWPLPVSTARRFRADSARSSMPGRSARRLRSLQPRPPPRRDRATHLITGPLRHRHRDPSDTSRNPHRCLQREPCPIPPPTTHATEASRGRPDQLTQPGSTHPIHVRSCLILLDTLRTGLTTRTIPPVENAPAPAVTTSRPHLRRPAAATVAQFADPRGRRVSSTTPAFAFR